MLTAALLGLLLPPTAVQRQQRSLVATAQKPLPGVMP